MHPLYPEAKKALRYIIETHLSSSLTLQACATHGLHVLITISAVSKFSKRGLCYLNSEVFIRYLEILWKLWYRNHKKILYITCFTIIPTILNKTNPINWNFIWFWLPNFTTNEKLRQFKLCYLISQLKRFEKLSINYPPKRKYKTALTENAHMH